LNKKDFEKLILELSIVGGVGQGTPKYEGICSKIEKTWEALKSGTDTDDDGRVTREEYLAWADKVSQSDPRAVRSLAESANSAVFDVLDSDNKGTISFEEFKKITYGLDESALQKIFNKIDTDNNGSLSREEYTKLVDYRVEV